MTSFSGNILTSIFPETNAVSYFLKNTLIYLLTLWTLTCEPSIVLCNGILGFFKEFHELFTPTLNVVSQLNVV